MEHTTNGETEFWQLTRKTGELALPVVKNLTNRLKRVQCGILCTLDGINIISLGVRDDFVNRMASQSGSLFSIGKNVLTSVAASRPNKNFDTEKRKEVMLMVDSLQILISELEHPKLGKMVFLVAVDETPSGLLLISVRDAIEEIESRIEAGMGD